MASDSQHDSQHTDVKDSQAGEAEDGTDPAETKPQPEWLSILASSQPHADRYNSTCHYILMVWHHPFWLRFILATWRQQVEDADSERMWVKPQKSRPRCGLNCLRLAS